MTELTDAEQLVLRAMLEVLARQPAELGEAAWHGLLEARLQNRVELAEFNALRDRCAAQRWLVGAPNPVTGKMRWAISAAGKIAMQQL